MSQNDPREPPDAPDGSAVVFGSFIVSSSPLVIAGVLSLSPKHLHPSRKSLKRGRRPLNAGFTPLRP